MDGMGWQRRKETPQRKAADAQLALAEQVGEVIMSQALLSV